MSVSETSCNVCSLGSDRTSDPTTRGGGRGLFNFHYKGIYTDVRLEGVYCLGLQVYEWVSFSYHKYINWVSFSLKEYYDYEWVKFEK